MARDGRKPLAACTGEGGSVTAEFAVVLPVVLLCLLSIAGVAVLGSATVRVQHAAGVAAREAARGQDASAVQTSAGDGAAVRIGRSGGWATASVERQVPLWGILGPSIRVTGEATARSEVDAQ